MKNTKSRILHFVVVISLLSQLCLAREAQILTGKLILKEDRVVCWLHNISDQDLLIRDLNYRISQTFFEEGDPFKRGKEWVYLRKAGSGFASDDYATTVNVDVRKWKQHILVKDKEEIVLTLFVATYAESIKGEWRPLKVVIPLVEHDEEEREAFSNSTKAEQGGTGQPATRPESKSEGGDKPQPASEGRSR